MPRELNQRGHLTNTAAMILVCICLQNIEKSSRESETNPFIIKFINIFFILLILVLNTGELKLNQEKLKMEENKDVNSQNRDHMEKKQDRIPTANGNIFNHQFSVQD